MKKFKKLGVAVLTGAIAFVAVGAVDLVQPSKVEASVSMMSFNNNTEAAGWNSLKTEMWFELDGQATGTFTAHWYLKRSSDQKVMQSGSKQVRHYAVGYYGTNPTGNDWVMINTQGLAPGEYETHWTYVMNGAVHRDVVKFNLASNGYFNFAGY